ncbi:STAS-like domain-containing protein [Bacteroides salyersiae]|uniref:STAS-like domain-containing protein n=1 Tax=Bacteroides salyersiae TaxID=291644 RepID=UPI001899B934|nr:STAS-like domain-containing protein [Bacteroides salyersiae]
MCTIKLYDVMNGKDFPDAGNSLYDLIVERMHDNERITIDLDGISSLPSMFLNVSIGRYMDEFGVESLRNKIGFVKITKAQAERIKEYIDKYVRK